MNAVSLDYYDSVLGAIAVSLLLGVAVGVATEVRLYYGVLVGSVLASVFLYVAMFRNPPLPDATRSAKAAFVVWHAYLLLLVLVGIT